MIILQLAHALRRTAASLLVFHREGANSRIILCVEFSLVFNGFDLVHLLKIVIYLNKLVFGVGGRIVDYKWWIGQ